MALSLSSAPTAEPVTAAQLRDHLRFDSTEEDAMLNRLIAAARRRIEAWEWRAHITQTWQLVLDRFPPLRCSQDWTIYVPRPPLQSVSSITYLDNQGDQQTLSSSLYRVDTSSRVGRITPAYGESSPPSGWPATRPVTGAVTVTFVAGYGDAATDVPEDTRQAILILAGQMWAQRLGEDGPNMIPPVIDDLLNRAHDDRLLEFH